MNDTIKGALIGAIIPTLGAFAIFFLGDFSTQSKLERDTVQVLSEKFDSIEKDMSYEDTLQAIFKENEDLKNNIGDLNIEINNLNNQINEQQAKIEQQNSADEINKIIQDATDYWNNSNYIQALTLLKNSKAKSLDIASLYEKYSDEYIMKLLSQADLYISERKYDEAIDILKGGKTVVNNDKMLNDKINDINNNQPIKLSDLKISASRFFGQNQDKPIEDTVGNRYSAGNSFITYAEGESNYGYATFYLGGEYTSLNGIVAVSDESENRSDTQLKGWVEIGTKNGDNFNPLWSSQTLSRMTSTEEIPELDITDAEWLEIRYYNNSEYWSLAAGYHSLRVIISDVMIYND